MAMVVATILVFLLALPFYVESVDSRNDTGGSKNFTRTGCFPGDALVLTPFGFTKSIKDVAVGDKVATSTSSYGEIIYEDVYALGHKDADILSEYIQLTIQSHGGETRTLHMTYSHFVPIMSSGGEGHVHRQAKDIKVGDVLWSLTDSNTTALSQFTVTETSKAWKQGLFNPYTFSGKIIVNNVLASVHSEWFLDQVFDAMGMTAWLPTAYQAILSPARLLYRIIGSDAYAAAYACVDSKFDIAKVGKAYGGVTVFATVAGLATLAMKRQVKLK